MAEWTSPAQAVGAAPEKLLFLWLKVHLQEFNPRKAASPDLRDHTPPCPHRLPTTHLPPLLFLLFLLLVVV